jgi:CHAT domain-containing protein/tetratricopeptide (TPR) repeat protein
VHPERAFPAPPNLWAIVAAWHAGSSSRNERTSNSRNSNRSQTAKALAGKSFQAAERLRLTWKSDSLAAALIKYHEARTYSAECGDVRSQALANLGAATVLFQLGKNQSAYGSYQTALRLSLKCRDTRLQIQALNGISYVLIDLGKLEASLQYGNRARAVSEQTGDRLGLATALNSIGLQYYSTGAIQKAIPILTDSVSVFKEAADRAGQAEALANLGYARADLGDTEPARQCFEQSLALATEAGDRRVQALDLTAIALVHSVAGETQAALDSHNRSLNILQDIGNYHGQGVVHNGIAYVYWEIGDTERALHHYSQALSLFAQTGDNNLYALTMGSIGDVHLSRGEPKQALSWYERRLALCRAIKSQWVATHTLNEIGKVYDAVGRSRKALYYFEQALAKEKALSDRKGRSYSLNAMGVAYEKLGQAQAALRCYEEALDLCRVVEERQGQIESLHNIARLERDLGNLERARQVARRAIDLLEQQPARMTGEEFRTSYSASVHGHYELYIDILMRMSRLGASADDDAAALAASEMSRARSLLDMLREARADVRQGVSPELLAQERSLQNTLNAKAARLTSLLNRMAGQDDIALLRKDLTNLTGDYEAIEAEIRARSPRYAALTQPKVLGLAEIQNQVLDPDTVLLEYSLGKDRSYLWAVSRDSVKSYELPARAAIETAAARLYNWISSPEARRHATSAGSTASNASQYELSKMILGPAAPSLATSRLVIVPDGLLQFVPFSVLVDPTKAGANGNAVPLAVDHQIIYLPSASVLSELRANPVRRDSDAKAVVVFADPVYDGYDSRVVPSNTSSSPQKKTRSGTRSGGPSMLTGLDNQEGPVHFQRLSFARQEAEDIANLVPSGNSRLFLDFDANLSAALEDQVGRASIIHFATHAMLDNSHAALSGIVLSLVDRQGRPTDGFLRLNEIYNMKLDANLVVLSACQTALGKDVEGEGLLGLTRGFMYAGAPRIVASLWEVDDRATEELMKYFYQGMLVRHLTASESLRSAQIAVRNQPQWRSPYFWAGFVLQGDWR